MYRKALRQPNLGRGRRRPSYGAKRYSRKRYGGRVRSSFPYNPMAIRKFPKRRKPISNRRRRW